MNLNSSVCKTSVDFTEMFCHKLLSKHGYGGPNNKLKKSCMLAF